MICKSFQILSIEITEPNAERQRDYGYYKITKNDITRKPRDFRRNN